MSKTLEAVRRCDSNRGNLPLTNTHMILVAQSELLSVGLLLVLAGPVIDAGPGVLERSVAHHPIYCHAISNLLDLTGCD